MPCLYIAEETGTAVFALIFEIKKAAGFVSRGHL
jgi:hypothetical protein